MRPRHFASENRRDQRPRGHAHRGFNEAEAFCLGKPLDALQELRADLASMRPRHFASENEVQDDVCGLVQEASMRPRHFASENAGRKYFVRLDFHASMRPRHFASENVLSVVLICPWSPGFNEAEAFCLGKLCGRTFLPAPPRASMRPRHFASENHMPRPCSSLARPCFNEAEAFCLGKHAWHRRHA